MEQQGSAGQRRVEQGRIVAANDEQHSCGCRTFGGRVQRYCDEHQAELDALYAAPAAWIEACGCYGFRERLSVPCGDHATRHARAQV